MERSDDGRFALTAEKYLAKHNVLIYIEDAIAQLLEHKDDNPKVNPSKFFSEYFNCVKQGNHTLFREYTFIQATPHNRASFVRTFWKCFRQIGKKGDLLSIREYHSLLCLLCPDFPFEPVQKTARIILMDDAMDCLISFSDFVYAFQAQFCFVEFLNKCAEVYKTLLKSPNNPQDPVVVPTDTEDNSTPATVHQNTENSSGEGVDSMHFFRALVQVSEKYDFNCPPVSVLKSILSAAPRVTFYGFLMAMAKSESLNASIGKLPKKTELLEVADQEMASSLKLPSSATNERPTSATMRPGSANPARRSNTASTAALLTSSKASVTTTTDNSTTPLTKTSYNKATKSQNSQEIMTAVSMSTTSNTNNKLNSVNSFTSSSVSINEKLKALGSAEISSNFNGALGSNSTGALAPSKPPRGLSLLGSSKGRALLRRSRMMNRLAAADSSDDSDDDTDSGSTTN